MKCLSNAQTKMHNAAHEASVLTKQMIASLFLWETIQFCAVFQPCLLVRFFPANLFIFLSNKAERTFLDEHYIMVRISSFLDKL